MNRLKKALRIALMSLKLLLSSLVLVAILTVLSRGGQMENSMLLPVLIFCLVVGSVFFHITYLKQKNNLFIGKRKIKVVYWVFNFLSAVSFIGVGLFFLYMMYEDPPRQNQTGYFYAAIYLILLLGLLSLIDMFFVHRYLKKNQISIDTEIDKIGR